MCIRDSDALEEFRRSHGSADYNSATPVMRQTLVNTVNEDLEMCIRDSSLTGAVAS